MINFLTRRTKSCVSLAAFWVIACGLFCNCSFGGDFVLAADDGWPPKDGATLLRMLTARDAQFENRTLEFEDRTAQPVSPRDRIASDSFQAFKYGGRFKAAYPKPIPAPYIQPHRIVYRLTTSPGKDQPKPWRTDRITLDTVEELEYTLHPAFSGQHVYGMRQQTDWMNLRTFHPRTAKWSTNGGNSSLVKRRSNIEWCCGYGFAHCIKSIQVVKSLNNKTIR